MQLTEPSSGRPTKWTPLKYREGKPLILSGALVMSLTPSSGMDFAQVSEGKGLIYAAIHQFGGTTHPKVTLKMRAYYWAKWFETQDEKWKWMAIGAKVGSTLTIKIPARPSLVWLDEDVERYKTMLLNWMVSFEDVQVAKTKRMAA